MFHRGAIEFCGALTRKFPPVISHMVSCFPRYLTVNIAQECTQDLSSNATYRFWGTETVTETKIKFN